MQAAIKGALMLIRQHLLCQAYHGIKKLNMHYISPYYITGLVDSPMAQCDHDE